MNVVEKLICPRPSEGDIIGLAALPSHIVTVPQMYQIDTAGLAACAAS